MDLALARLKVLTNSINKKFVGPMEVTMKTPLKYLMLSMLSLLFLLSACGTSNVPGQNFGSNPQPSVTQEQTTSQEDPTVQSTSGQYPIKVFFSKSPESENDFTLAFPVDRISPTSGVATFAIEQMIAGPTEAEQQQGYYLELSESLSGPSNCGDKDFTLVLDHKGDQPEAGTATLSFCRDVLSAGIGNDARTQSAIEATLTQFSTITNVVILNRNGHCLGDESGMDTCLQ